MNRRREDHYNENLDTARGIFRAAVMGVGLLLVVLMIVEIFGRALA